MTEAKMSLAGMRAWAEAIPADRKTLEFDAGVAITNGQAVETICFAWEVARGLAEAWPSDEGHTAQRTRHR